MTRVKFGTDGWRGVIADDFTFATLSKVAAAAATVLYSVYHDRTNQNRQIIIGYDRRFLAEDFALSAAKVVAELGFEVLLSNSYAPTPAFSWNAYEKKALGALVITASHNPGNYLGLKVKGGFGGSVSGEITDQIEQLLNNNDLLANHHQGSITYFDPWESYYQVIRQKVDISLICNQIQNNKLVVMADVMHGSAAGGLEKILGIPIIEINHHRDPLFGGKPPEPLPRYIQSFLTQIKEYHPYDPDALVVGFVFDGDADRIAAVDGTGNFHSSQHLIPILIQHLSKVRGVHGEVVKTVSGSDLIELTAKLYNLPVFETPVGYKYIADRMNHSQVLIGGEESGGIGYGDHIPERDALLSALYVLEAIAISRTDLGILYQKILNTINFTKAYDRIDIKLKDLKHRNLIQQELTNNSPVEIAQKKVITKQTTDGYKLRLEDQSWLMIRFSGTEPLLRLYCEATTIEQVSYTLEWAKNWALSIN